MFSKTKNITFRKLIASTILVAFTTLSASAINNVKLKDSVSPELSGSAKIDTMKINSSAFITQSNQKISLSLRDSDVKQVLRMFATKAQMNIIFHDSVTGKITLDLIETPINEAFELVLDTMGLTYFKDGKTIVVAKNDSNAAISVSKRNLTSIPVKYVNAADIANFLNKNVYGAKMIGLSTGEIATVNSISNDLLIFGSQADIDAAKKVIEKFDKKQPMKTFVVNHTTPKEMADLICKAFYDQGSGSSGSGSGSSGGFGGGSEGGSDGSDGGSEGGSGGSEGGSDGGSGGGTATGFAGSAGGGGGGGSGSGGSSGGGGGGSGSSLSDVQLGGGTVACSVDKSAVQSRHASFGKFKSQVVYFPQQGTLSIYGASDEQIEMIAEFIKENDKKQLMAYLEMTILELNEEGSRELSAQWTLTSPMGSFSFDGASDGGGFHVSGMKVFSDNHGAEFFPSPPKGGYTSLNLTLNNILKNGNGRSLANPKMMITNGQKTVLDMTEDYIESVDAEIQDNNSYGGIPIVERTINTANDLGLKIELMPFITPDGYVNFNIRPSYSTIKDQPKYVLVGGEEAEVVATLLQRRNIELNNLRVKDGETLVLAGLINETENQTVNKVPFFGDLPVVGFMFRYSKNEKKKSELVIMLTPHIVYDDNSDIPTNL